MAGVTVTFDFGVILTGRAADEAAGFSSKDLDPCQQDMRAFRLIRYISYRGCPPERKCERAPKGKANTRERKRKQRPGLVLGRVGTVCSVIASRVPD